MTKHKVFISYHHDNDQWAKEKLLELNSKYDIFIDGSVDTGDISDDLSDEEIRKKIRDEYLRDTTVTILLVGTETKNRKHIDWELYSSMYDGKVNKKVRYPGNTASVNKPSVYYSLSWWWGKINLYQSVTNWISIDSRDVFERRYPYLPERIIDNLLAKDVKISVTKWEDLNVEDLRLLIDLTYQDKESCQYDMSRKMRRNNS